MGKKILAVLLVLLLGLSVGLGVPAAEQVGELLTNGDMEAGREGWGTSGNASKWNQTIVLDTEVFHNGKQSMKMIADETQVIAKQELRVKEKTNISFSGYFRRTEETVVGVIKMTWADANEKTLTSKQHSFSSPVGEWKKVTYDHTVPEGACYVTIMYRVSGVGTGWWDDMSARGVIVDEEEAEASTNTVKEPAPVYPVKEPVPGAQNLVLNAGFEELGDQGMPVEWSVKNETCQLVTDKVHSGKNAMKIAGAGGTEWIAQSIPVEPCTEYQISSWVYFEGESVYGSRYKLEYYVDHNPDPRYVDSGYVNDSGHTESFNHKGEWFRYVQTTVTPPGCHTLKVYLRTRSAGNTYWDDIEVLQVGETARLDLRTDEIFYWSEWETGYATATAMREEDADKFVKFRILDGESVLTESRLMPLNGQTSTYVAPGAEAPRFDFPIALLEEYMKEYTMEVQLCEADGTVLYATDTDIYRSSRPEILNEDGTVTMNGETFVPSIMYHVSGSIYSSFPKWGVNLVQSGYCETPEDALKKLDSFEQAGVKVLLQLYWQMNPAGSPVNAEKTKAIVEAVKDHPALFGYMQMDEPGDQTCDYEALKNGYKIIRSIDKKHAVYACECQEGAYGATGKVVDVLSNDPYPTEEGKVVSAPYDLTKWAIKDVRGRKPVYQILQAFDYKQLAPTYNDMKTQIYGSLFAGGAGPGYFGVDYLRGAKPMPKTEVFLAVEDFVKNEADILYRHFYDKEGGVFAEKNGPDVRYQIWEDNGDLIVMLSDADTTDKKVSIPLTSYDGSISVGEFTATVVSNPEAEAISGNGVLEYDLKARESVLFRVTPKAKTDFSGLLETKYFDLFGYSWARNEIITLSDKGIVNDYSTSTFAPERNITRGDLAYFLVRTLGLTSDSTENFADVCEEKYYAKEIATGKALGILNGIGDDCFRPEAEITRQDLMTMISRAMKLTGENVDLAAYSDADGIAEYALPHVKAMVGTGLIKGNADGTLNPLGQATRAEAAVIMYRILQNQ